MKNQSGLGVGIIGVGAFGIQYVKALKYLSNVDLKWVCDIHPGRAAEVARQYGIPESTPDVDDVLADPEIELVAVVTPEFAHRDVVIAALDAGKHVIVEKPLATEEADAMAMCEAQERTGKLLMTAFLMRFDQRYARIQQLLERIAPLRAIHTYRNFDRGLFEVFHRTHSFIENAIHDIDLILWFVDSPVRNIHGFGRNTLGLSTPDINVGIIEFENGVLATVHTAWLYPRQQIERIQWNVGMQVMGARGVLEAANDRGGLRSHIEDEGIALLDQSGWSQIHGEPRGAFGAMLRHQVACAQGAMKYCGASPRQALQAMRVAKRLADAGTRSAENYGI